MGGERRGEVKGQVYIDPTTLTWDGHNWCWVWSSPSGLRYFHPHFGEEYNRAEQPRKGRLTRPASLPIAGRRGLWGVKREALIAALRAAGEVVRARHEELEAARRAIQVRRQAERMEGVVTVTECAHCGAPPAARGTACRYCGTVAPG
jgi:hypothetical protein